MEPEFLRALDRLGRQSGEAGALARETRKVITEKGAAVAKAYAKLFDVVATARPILISAETTDRSDAFDWELVTHEAGLVWSALEDSDAHADSYIRDVVALYHEHHQDASSIKVGHELYREFSLALRDYTERLLGIAAAQKDPQHWLNANDRWKTFQASATLDRTIWEARIEAMPGRQQHNRELVSAASK